MRAALRVLRFVTPAAHREFVVGDTLERVAEIERERGERAASRWLRREMWRAVVHAPRFAVAAPRIARGGSRMNASDVVEAVGRDLRQALRTLRRRPAFTCTAILTLALGIGATTAIFSVVYSVLIKPLPYPQSEELVRIRHNAAALGANDLSASTTMYLTYRQENRTLAEIGFFGDGGETLTSPDGTERVRSLRVTHGVLQALGVQPLRGRWFTEQEHGPAAEGPAPVILSHAFWQSRFGGDPATLGRELSINGQPSQVVGIMPRDFRFLDLTPQADIVVALRLDPAREAIGGFFLQALARLKPGVTPAEASADIERMLPLWLDAWPTLPGFSVTKEAIANWRITPVVRTLKDDLVGDVASSLWVLMGAIGAVLLVACANIANLMLVRAEARRQEFAVRAALGAGRARIARELLVESLVLGAIGGVLGLVLAYAGLRALVAIGPANLPRLGEIAVYPPVLAFTFGVALASTLVFGSITALKHAWRLNVSAIGGARGTTAGRERNATRSALVVVQVALALVLVVGAMLMVRTFEALRDVHPGFADAGAIQTVRTWAPNALLRDARQFTRVQHEILDAVAALPGVEAAAFTSGLPMEGAPFIFNAPIAVEGRPLAPGETPPPARLKLVSPGFFTAMGTQIIAGRDFTWSDVEAGGRVALISEDFAREIGARPEDALGRRVRTPNDSDAWREVIGVVQSVKDDSLYARAPSLVYFPPLMENAFGAEAFGMQTVAYVVHSERTGTATFVNEIRQAVWSVNGAVPVALPRTIGDLYAASLARTSFALVMLGIAGAMALVLSIIGIYGVIAYVVSQRGREIGIRMALGAGGREVRAMFVRHGLALSGVGLAIGLVAALALTRLMSSLLFGIAPTDVVTYAAALGVILTAAALASYLPARRATTIDPVETLKSE
jgi:predicted permease